MLLLLPRAGYLYINLYLPLVFFDIGKLLFFAVVKECLRFSNHLERLPSVVFGGVTLPTYKKHHLEFLAHVARMVNDLVNEKLFRIASCYLNGVKFGQRVVSEFRKVRHMFVEDLVGSRSWMEYLSPKKMLTTI